MGTKLHGGPRERMRPRVIVLDDQKYLRDIIAAILDDVGYPALAVATTD